MLVTLKDSSVLIGLIAICMGLGSGVVTAHPPISAGFQSTAPSGRRVPLRVTRPPRIAPDNQLRPLEEGTRPEIDPAHRVVVRISVHDSDTQKMIPIRVHVEDHRGNYFPPVGHYDITLPNWNSSNVSYEPDTNNDGYDWAMIPEGKFTIELPAVDGLKVRVSHGLEYPLETFELNLAGKQGQTLERTFVMSRGINMRAKGWMSVDTHVHNLTPLGAIRQMPIEGIDYVNLMFIGPTHPLLRRKYITGKPSPLSTKDHIVYVSQEVRDANQGHMTLVGIRMPIDPIRVYTGTSLLNNLKSLPNEPLNWEVYDRMHAQGGLAFHAHFLYWPGYGSAVGAAIDKLDGLEWLRTDTVSRNDRSRQNIEVPGHGRRASVALWYDMLNCGINMPIIGGTDKMSAGRVVGGSSRTYVKVDQWSHESFMAGLQKGETFVTNGPLLSFSVNDQPIGSEIKLHGDGPQRLQLSASCFTQIPIKHFEVVVNGTVVHHIEVKPQQKQVKIDREIELKESSWIAVRARHDVPNPDNWHRGITAAHSSPIYVIIKDEKPAMLASAKYLVARLDETIRWAQQEAHWSSDESRQKAINSFKAAREVYLRARDRAVAIELD